MSGRIIPPSAAHRCEGRPSPDGFAAGTRWRCDDCGKESIVVEGSQYNERYLAWRDVDGVPIRGEYRGPEGDDR